jgi:hypothetical protein
MLNKQRIFGIAISCCGGLYFYNKPHKKTIRIKEIYDFQRIKTDEDEIYNVVTPLSKISHYPVWWKIEKIDKNDDTEITYYGINIPMFEFYPKIYEVYNENYERNLKKELLESMEKTKKIIKDPM